MARKRKPPSPPPGIPAWFMTYSDVITLLMTFFILLMTFATSEPEEQKKLQTSMFAGTGSMGLAAQRKEKLDRDSVVARVRERDEAGRDVRRGSRVPQMYSDPAHLAIDKGLKSLEEDTDLENLDRLTFETPISAFATDDGRLTSAALHHIQLLASQMRRVPIEVKFEVRNEQDLAPIMEMCDVLTNKLKIPTGRISTQINDTETQPREGLRISVTRPR